MNPGSLVPKRWYYVRKSDGILVPYRLHRVIMLESPELGDSTKAEAEMFVGSMIKTFPVNQIVAPAEMPEIS